jgi:hypothetical protein
LEDKPNEEPLKLFYSILEEMKTAQEEWSIFGQLSKFEREFKKPGLKNLLDIVTDAIINGSVWISPDTNKYDLLTYGICHVKQKEGKNEYILDEVCIKIHEIFTKINRILS